MTFILHRYVFRELLKVFALTTLALTLMMSFGMVLRPVQQYSVPPGQVINLLGYFLPITLTFVLPIGALFAASFTYGRFAADNELNACKASGVSLMTVVYPGLCLAILVAVATLVLSFHVAPAFVHRSARTIKANARQILFRNLHRKGFHVMSDKKDPGKKYAIQADRVDTAGDTLYGVVITVSYSMDVQQLITAGSARVVFKAGRAYDEVTVIAEDVRQIDQNGQKDFSSLPFSSRFEPLLADDIKFQSLEQIKRIKADMLQFRPLLRLALEVSAQLVTEMLSESMNAAMSAGNNKYYRLVGKDRVVLISAAEFRPSGNRYQIEFEGPIRVLELDLAEQELLCQWDCAEGFIRIEQQEDTACDVELVLENPAWQKSGQIRGLAQRHVVKSLQIPPELQAKNGEQSLPAAIASIGTAQSPLKSQPSDLLVGLKNTLRQEILETGNSITAEVHSRLVFGLGCVVLILTGIAMGIVFKGGHLLSAFGAGSLPAAVLIVFIMAGKNLTKNISTPTATGVIVMWAGFLLLTILMLIIYRRLLKT